MRRSANGSSAIGQHSRRCGASSPTLLCESQEADGEFASGCRRSVAEAKRRSARALRDPEREARVLEAGQAAVREAAARLGSRPPPEADVRALYRALIDGALAIEQATLERPAGAAPVADLEREIRPALVRLGERIADLVVRLPTPLAPAEARAAATAALRTPDLPAAARDRIADAIAALASARPAPSQ